MDEMESPSKNKPRLSPKGSQGMIHINKNPVLPPEVYYKLTEYLDLPTLKSFRLSTKMFADLATSTLLKRDGGCTLSIAYHKSFNKFFPCRPLSKNCYVDDSLENLSRVIAHSSRFPCNGLNLTHVPCLSCPEIFEFLKKHGHLLKYLKLTIFAGQPSLLVEIPQILLLTPNLERFQLWNMDVRMEDDVRLEIEKKVEMPENLKLVSLKCLTLFRYIEYKEIVKTILKGSPSLEKCEHLDHSGLSPQLLNLLIETNKVGTLQQLRIYSPLVDLYDLLSKYEPRLTSLTLNMGQIVTKSNLWFKFANVISKLLLSSSKTLVKIQIESPLGFLDKLKWPRLEKCRNVLIEIQSFGGIEHSLIVPWGFEWSKVMPKLSHVTLDFWYLDEQTIGGIFPLDGVSESVGSLKILCRNYHTETPYPISWFEGLRQLFPNLRNLHVKISPNYFAKVANIFASLKIQTLCLEIVTHCPQFGIDMALTGLSEQDCQNIAGGKINLNGTNSPLTSFQDLRNLEIIFGSDQRWHQTICNNFFMTKISFTGALQFMPNLHVTIIVRSDETELVNKLFESIAPHVNLQIVPP